jgi:hypothetical protein
MIVRWYGEGLGPSRIGELLKKSASSISTFYSRYQLTIGMDQRTVQKTRITDGRVGLAIKNLLVGNAKLSLRKIETKLRGILGNGSRYLCA